MNAKLTTGELVYFIGNIQRINKEIVAGDIKLDRIPLGGLRYFLSKYVHEEAQRRAAATEVLEYQYCSELRDTIIHLKRELDRRHFMEVANG